MSAETFRLPRGGLIDRGKPLSFRFDGRALTGFAGDTLASALLANDVRLIGRSFKYHRPRGILSIGAEEPNAIVHLGTGARREPNTRATMAELFDGLEAHSQHAWPSLRFDLGVVNGLFAPFFAAGFYYKTFMGPRRSSWMFYERLIRAVAGLGEASREPDPDRYEKMHAHADIAIIGGGPAGLSAALAAAETGARVVLIDEAARFGGWLLRENDDVEGAPGADWVTRATARLAAMPNVTLLPRSTAFGIFDGGTIGAVERVSDHLRAPAERMLRQRFWVMRAKRIVLAAGAIEQPLVFAGNDRPGVMLAGAVRGYLNQYGVACGRHLAVFASDDSAYHTALDCAEVGLEVRAVIDSRAAPDGPLVASARERGIEVLTGFQVTRTHYGSRLYGVDVAQGDSPARFIDCDCLAMSAGWAPTLHLSSHLGGRPAFDAGRAMFLPAAATHVDYAGACMGLFALKDCLASGREAGLRAAQGGDIPSRAIPAGPLPEPEAAPAPKSPERGTAFVDFQNDVTTKDIALAVREGYVSVEHLKRYTTLGMGTDQGKTSNLAGLGLLSSARELPVASVGTTTFRPPYTPIALGALAGHERGQHFAPLRRTPMQDWHEASGAVMGEAGLWRRPKAYLRDGEDVGSAGQREAIAVRAGVGIVDVSTLGKIEVQGPDAAAFLDRIYCNAILTLKTGRARYGVMLREDGMVLDDGTIARLADDHFYISTTTAQAGKVMDHLERYAQVVWPHLRVRLTSVSDQFAAIAVAGPKSRELLGRLGGEIDFDDRAFPYPAVRLGLLGGVPVRALRVSYSGERAYEVHLGADTALGMWQMLLEKGADLGVTPYGTEAMGILRIEKGHVAGPELDGRTTPGDLGLAKMVRWEKEFVGKPMLQRPALKSADRPALVGLVPADGKSKLRTGAQLTLDDTTRPPVEPLGHLTSVCFSPHLGHPVALALVAGGVQQTGSTLFACFPLRNETVAVRVVPPVFVDPEGKNLHA